MAMDSGILATIDVHKVAADAVKRIFDRSEEDGRCIHRDAAIAEVEKAIRAGMQMPEPAAPDFQLDFSEWR